MIQVQGVNIQLTLRSLYSIEHPQTLALIESLAYNQSLGLNWIRDTLETPLVMSGIKKKSLDNPLNKKYFQTTFKFDLERPIWKQQLKISLQQFEVQV